VPFWRVSRSSARNEAWPLSGTTPERLGRTSARSASGHLPKQLGGSTPAASTPHRGARFAFDAMKHRSAEAGVDPASWRTLPGATSKTKVLLPPGRQDEAFEATAPGGNLAQPTRSDIDAHRRPAGRKC
jgi:hypothetical protein